MTPLHLIIFLFIGHSNMTGYCAAMDTVKAPHVWSYSAARGFYNCDDRDLESGAGSPVMPFLKRMALMYPGYNFCGIRFAGPCRQAFHVYTEKRHREAIENIVAQVKDKGTFGGALVMAGYIEGQFKDEIDSFDIKFITMAKFIREATGNPSLPIILGRYEENGATKDCPEFHQYDPILIEKINGMPHKLADCSLTPRQPVPANMYCDNHHYSADGYRLWAHAAASIIQYSGYDGWAHK